MTNRSHGAERVGAVLGGRYRLERLLGAGGMGAVYEAVDPEGRRFAIKLLIAAPGKGEEMAPASLAKR